MKKSDGEGKNIFQVNDILAKKVKQTPHNKDRVSVD